MPQSVLGCGRCSAIALHAGATARRKLAGPHYWR
jgi:hypothetical protein